MSTRRALAKECALSLGAVLGLFCIAAALAAVVFGITPLVFRSGSMAPTITTGSLALGKDVPATILNVGDIVSVDRADGSRITHRVTAVDDVVGNSATLTLKGDANAVPDAEPYVVSGATRVVAHVPYLGYFVAWLSTPFAWVLGAGLSAALLVAAFKPSDESTGRHSKPNGPGESGKSAVVGSVVLVTAVASIVGVGFSRADLTSAALQDTAQANGTVTAATLAAPSPFSCKTRPTTFGNAVDLTFPNVNPLYSYVLTFTGGLLGSPSPVTLGPFVTQGSTITYTPAGSLLSVGNYTVTIVSKYGSFVSAPALSRTYRAFTSLNVSCTPADGSAAVTTTPRSARVATAETPSVNASTTAATTSPAATTPLTTTPSTTTTSSPVTATTTSPPPTTTTTTPRPSTTPPPTTTTQPPPSDAFIPSGSAKTSGPNTASIADGQLTVTDGTGTAVFTRPVTSSAKYGTGIVWSSTGDLYALSESAGPVKISPTADGTWAATPVDTSALPSDIAALV